jgi:hypothetical protein
MDVMLTILIGLAAGLLISVLAPDMGPRTVSRTGTRRIRGMAIGMIGAVAVSSTYVRLHGSGSADGLTMALIALAGALWVAGIVEVYWSRRRRGEDTAPRQPARIDAVSPIEMPAYDAARQALVAGLIEDALAHEAGRYAEIGRQFPAVRDRVSRQDTRWNSRLQLAVRFWRGWTQARDGKWRAGGAEHLVPMADWPRYARTIASDLALDRDTMDPAIVGRFAYVTPRLSADPATPPRATAVPVLRAADPTTVAPGV